MSREMKLWAIIDELRAENRKLEQTMLKRVDEFIKRLMKMVK